MKIINIIIILILIVLVSGCETANERIANCEKSVKDAYGYENPTCSRNPAISHFDCHCDDQIKKGNTLTIKNNTYIEFNLVNKG